MGVLADGDYGSTAGSVSFNRIADVDTDYWFGDLWRGVCYELGDTFVFDLSVFRCG